MKVWIETLGCKVNTYESEVIKNSFLNEGYSLASNNKEADIIIINTCSVTNQSDAKSRKVIRFSKRENPNAIIVVCGCSAQHFKEELLPLGIDILIGNKDKSKIVFYVKEFLNKRKPIVKFYDLMNTEFENMTLDKYNDRTRAFIKIQDGCNNYCTYCIIPYMRGTLRNKEFDVVIDEVKCLAKNGFKEIVLTGIHTGSYPNLTKLIHEISNVDGIERIRISSIEITEIDDEFLNELKNNPKICNQIHIPIQSGSDDVLKKMNRKYDINKYKSIISSIRSVREDINITTDLIVGFPTETKENFEESLKNAEDINFGKIHVFPFSLRNGTAAAKMKNIVSDQEKKDRCKRMIQLSEKLEHNYYERFIGKELDVLIEEVFDNYSVGHTSNYIKVRIEEKLEHNKDYLVKIISVNGLTVNGIAIKK